VWLVAVLLTGVAVLVGVVQALATSVVSGAVGVRASAVAALKALAVLCIAPFLTPLRRVMDLGAGRAGMGEQ